MEEQKTQTDPDSKTHSESFITINDLWKVYGKDPKRILGSDYKNKSKDTIQEETGCIVAMREISLEIKKGEFYILMGLSGSGKSTLVRNLIRLVEPTSGSIHIGGKDITRLKQDKLLEFRKKNFGMVFQHYGLFPHMTVLDNAAYGLKVKDLPKGERYAKAMKTLETVGLSGWEDYYPGNLSGGMQQRVGLARALANEPEILLMDEPFSGLDPLIRRQMQDELVELQEKLQKTIIFVTHDLHEALKLGDRIAILRNGEVVQIGTPEEIVTDPEDEYVREFVRDASPAKVLTAGTIMEQPEVLLYDWEGPKTAEHIIQKSGKRGLFVVDKKGRLIGVTSLKRIAAIDKDTLSAKSKIPAAAIRKVPTVTEDTILEDIFTIISDNPYPVPVVSETGKLKGIVKTDTIFENISPITEGEDHA